MVLKVSSIRRETVGVEVVIVSVGGQRIVDGVIYLLQISQLDFQPLQHPSHTVISSALVTMIIYYTDGKEAEVDGAIFRSYYYCC